MRRRARERVGGSSAHTKQNDRPELVSKISHLQKSSALESSNLTLHDRRILENPLPPYAALRAAREKFSENDVSFIRAPLYDQVRRLTLIGIYSENGTPAKNSIQNKKSPLIGAFLL